MKQNQKNHLGWIFLIAVVLGLWNYSAIERFFVLDKWEKENRIKYLKPYSLYKIDQLCQSLNAQYTPKNAYEHTQHEIIKYKSPYLVFTFRAIDPEIPLSRCLVDIGYDIPEFSFYKQGEFGSDYFCTSIQDPMVPTCPVSYR
jgi:hypothetical protein